MKKFVALLISSVLSMSALASCAPATTTEAPKTEATTETAPASETPATSEATKASGDVKQITLYNNKVEIDGALKKYAAVYEQQTGVKVDVRTAGGDTSYSVQLKADLQGGLQPEIMVFEGPSSYEPYADRFADLSSEPWVADTDLAFKVDGKVYGFPVSIEGYGLAYNKDLLDKAGIDPTKLTNNKELKAAFETLESKKAELGIDSVVSLAAGPGMEWVTGLHNFNVYLTGGLDYNDTSIADKLLTGEVDEARFNSYAQYVALLFKYSNPKILQTGSYDDQINAFAKGKAVFLHQGNWAEPNIKNAGATFNMAFAPHAFLDTDTPGVFAAAPSWYGVNSKAAGFEEAKKFLQALASTPEGHSYMVNDAGMIPAFKSVTLKPAGLLSQSIMQFSNDGKIYSWQQYKMPDGFGMQKLGAIYQLFASGSIGVDEFATQMKAQIKKINE